MLWGMADEFEAAPVSLAMRQHAKKKTLSAGIIATVIGVPLIGISIFYFARGGAEMLGVVTGALGLGITAVGISQLRKAAAQR
jgi:hypothetical protein